MEPPIDPAQAIALLERELAPGLELIAAANDLPGLEGAETAVLGRKSPIARVQKSLGGLSPEDRRRLGQRTNEVIALLREAVAARRSALEAEDEAALLEAGRIDVTLPGRRPRIGSLHPLTVAEYRIVDIFTRLGYRVVECHECETAW